MDSTHATYINSSLSSKRKRDKIRIAMTIQKILSWMLKAWRISWKCWERKRKEKPKRKKMKIRKIL